MTKMSSRTTQKHKRKLGRGCDCVETYTFGDTVYSEACQKSNKKTGKYTGGLFTILASICYDEMSWRKEHNSAVQAYSSAQSAISFVIWYQITETIKEDAQNGSEQKNKKKRARALFLCKLTTNTNFKTLGCWGNVNKYKSHKPRFYSQENIKNVSNVKTETFYYSIIFWQQHISKLGQGEETAEKVVVINSRR